MALLRIDYFYVSTGLDKKGGHTKITTLLRLILSLIGLFMDPPKYLGKACTQGVLLHRTIEGFRTPLSDGWEVAGSVS